MTQVDSYEAAGLGAYYDSKPISLSYASIFDSLSKQAELHEKLSQAYEQLKIHRALPLSKQPKRIITRK